MNIFTKSFARGETNMPINLVDLIRTGNFKKFRKVYGFSLMEMMVVMLVVAIILALSSPMITKKNATDGVNRELWDILADGSTGPGSVGKNSNPHIGWNKNKKEASAIIGGAEADIAKFAPNGRPGLIIHTSEGRPHIAFMYDGVKKGTLDMIKGLAVGEEPKASAEGSVSIGNQAKVENIGASNAIAIGAEATAGGNTTAPVAGKDAFAAGYQANASGINSMAIGYGANATANAVALGGGKALTDGAVALGYNSNTTGSTSAVAIGYNAKLNNSLNSVAIGSNIELTGVGSSVAIGYNVKGLYASNIVYLGANASSTSGASNSAVIGYNSKVIGQNALAVGAFSYGTTNAIALGARANASSSNGMAIGSNSKALGNAIAIGYNAYASTEALALGAKANSTGLYATTIGMNAVAGTNSVAIGAYSGGSYANSFAIGRSAKLIGSESVALGYSANAGGSSAVAVGNSAKAPSSSVALGSNAQSSGSDSVVIGRDARASYGAVVVGSGTSTGSNSGAVAIGRGAQATGTSSLAIGRGAQATGTSSIAIGKGAIIKGKNSVAVGQIESHQSEDNAIILGNGTTHVIIPGKLVLYSREIEGDTKVKGSVLIENHLVVKKGAALGVMAYGGDWDSYGGKQAFTAFKDYEYSDNTVTVMERYGGEWEEHRGRLTCFDVISRYGLTTTFKDACSSDIRLKDVIGENLDAMDKINRLKVYDYTYKKDDLKTPHVGVIAQDLQKIFPKAVGTSKDGFLFIRHEDIFYAMVNALKELDARVKKIATALSDNVKLALANAERIEEQEKEMKQIKKEIITLRKQAQKAIKKRRANG